MSGSIRAAFGLLAIKPAPELLVPVLREQKVLGWPAHFPDVVDQEAARNAGALYVSLADALTSDFPVDAHTAAYSIPSIGRRLADASVFDALKQRDIDGVPMRLLIIDVDPPGHKATPEWRADVRASVERLCVDHPGYFFTTRGGCRIVYRLREPFVLRSTKDAERWKRQYAAWLEYLRTQYGIVGDEACKDWTRLYRLPRVMRDGAPQQPDTIGDPHDVGVWDVVVDVPETPERSTAVAVGDKIPEGQRNPTLLSLAGTMRSRGFSEDAITAALLAENVSKCDPPLDASEVDAIVASVMRYEPTRDVVEEARTEEVFDRLLAPQASSTTTPSGSVAAGDTITLGDPGDLIRYHDGDEIRGRYDQAIALLMSRGHDVRRLITLSGTELKAMIDAESSKVLGAYLEDVAAQDKLPVRTYSTGIADLDRLLAGGLTTRTVHGVLGPPSLGKSAFVGSIALYVAEALPVLHASTELESDELMSRHAAHILNVPWRECVKGVISRERQLEAVRGKRIRVIGCDALFGSDASRRDPLAAVCDAALAMKQQHGVAPAIILDYVQVLARGSEDGVRARVGELTMRLRVMSQELDCPIVPVFSIPRTFYTPERIKKLRDANDPRAYLAAAKESGDIEYDCATILFLDVDEVAPITDQPLHRDARIAVARCRMGEEGFVGMRFEVASGRWTADALASLRMTSGQTQIDRSKAQTRAAVAELVAKVRAACDAGDYRTKSQLKDSGMVKNCKQVLDEALATGELKTATITRVEGHKPKERDCVVPKHWQRPPPGTPANGLVW